MLMVVIKIISVLFLVLYLLFLYCSLVVARISDEELYKEKSDKIVF